MNIMEVCAMGEESSLDIIEPMGVCPPQGLYSHAIAVGAGKLLFLAGQTAVDAENQLVGPGDFRRQMKQVFINLSRILHSAGSSFDRVVKYTTYLVRSRDLKDFYELRSAIYADIYRDERYPPNTLVVVDQLAREEWLIEIEAIAVI
jgi:enamine deaminase RidA (YjgF/YER057c/UK114 family)